MKKLKRTAAAFLCLAVTVVLLLTGCGRNPSIPDQKKTRKAAKQVIKVIDGYLDGTVSAEEADSQISEIMEKNKLGNAMEDMDDLEKATMKDHINYMFAGEVSVEIAAILQYMYLYEMERTQENHDLIAEYRDYLAETAETPYSY